MLLIPKCLGTLQHLQDMTLAILGKEPLDELPLRCIENAKGWLGLGTAKHQLRASWWDWVSQ